MKSHKFYLSVLISLLGLGLARIASAQDIESADFEVLDVYNDSIDFGNADSEYSEEVGMQTPRLSGSGCTPESFQASLSTDKKTLSVLFDSFRVEAGFNVARLTEQKSCSLEIPFHTPSGFRAVLTAADIRGFNDVPRGAASSVTTGFQFLDRNSRKAVTHTMNRSRKFMGPLSEEFFLTSQTSRIPTRLLVSECGQDFILRVDARVQAWTNQNREQTLSMLDTLDTQVGVRQVLNTHLMWVRCTAPHAQTGRPTGPARPAGPVVRPTRPVRKISLPFRR